MNSETAHITTGIRKILELPIVYDTWQSMVGNKKALTRYIRDYVKPFTGADILDIGCGTGYITCFLPEYVRYTGLDLNASYIEKANRLYHTKGQFLCADAADTSLIQGEAYDIVMANALLHHLTDAQSLAVIQAAYEKLKPGGHFITYDGVYVQGQNPIAKWLLSKDRGQMVRTQEQYEKLFRASFKNLEITVLHDLYRMPYSTIIFRCRK